MDIQKFKKLKISWLGQCPKCELDEHVITTREGTENQLYEGDQVECWCGQTGIIETDGAGVAWCEWDKKPRTDLDRFNDYYREKFSKNWAVLPKQNHHACTHYYDCLNAWQEAKAQAVPEGFVLVSSKSLCELAIAINNVDLATHTENKTNEVREMWQDIAIKLSSLGEAQEQRHD